MSAHVAVSLHNQGVDVDESHGESQSARHCAYRVFYYLVWAVRRPAN